MKFHFRGYGWGSVSYFGKSSLILAQDGCDRVQMCISGACKSSLSRTPRGIAIISGKSSDSNQTGEPQEEQKHRRPFPESYLDTLEVDDVTVSFDVLVIAHTAGQVPEDFLQCRQWQYRPSWSSSSMVNVTELHRQDPLIMSNSPRDAALPYAC